MSSVPIFASRKIKHGLSNVCFFSKPAGHQSFLMPTKLIIFLRYLSDSKLFHMTFKVKNDCNSNEIEKSLNQRKRLWDKHSLKTSSKILIRYNKVGMAEKIVDQKKEKG